MAQSAAQPLLRDQPPFKQPPTSPPPRLAGGEHPPLWLVHPAFELTRPVLMDFALHEYLLEAENEWFDSVGHIESVMTPEGQQWRMHMALPGKACLVVTGLVTAVGVYQRPQGITGYGPVRRWEMQEPVPEPYARPSSCRSDASPSMTPPSPDAQS